MLILYDEIRLQATQHEEIRDAIIALNCELWTWPLHDYEFIHVHPAGTAPSSDWLVRIVFMIILREKYLDKRLLLLFKKILTNKHYKTI